MAGKTIKVKCQCGNLLFKYHKDVRGRLQKCYLDMIRKDYVGLKDTNTGSTPTCPHCHKSLGIIKMIHGRPAIDINQGTVEKIRT